MKGRRCANPVAADTIAGVPMIQLPSRIRPLAAIAASACTVFLLGCPQQQTAAKPPANSTAPALPKTVGGNNAQTAEQTNPRIAELIQQVDRSYRSGVQNYRAGNLDGARSDFDHAVDLMLTSGLDIKSDPTLSDEFERTVDAVNSLEMDALKQGNGFSPKQEETPLEAVNDLTFSDATPEQTASLKSTLNTTSDLPLVINPEVAGYINAFANSRSFTAHMRASLERLGKYKDMMQGVLREEGVPQDMIYLAVAESGFQPQAMNASSGAGGMWQFMPFKGAYGLERNGYFDERFDPEKSTRAYAKYMKGLYDQFGDWYLAMGGYDWGPGNMQRAVQRTGYADYWELYRRNAMPRETKNYVPQILAAILMAKNPEKYGLTDLHPAAPVLYDTVTVDYAMDLHLAADITGASMTDLVGLNPALLRLSTPDGVPFDLHIPKGTKDNFNERIAAIPVEKRSSWRFHEVVAGESLDQVAQLYKVSAADILAANDLPANSAVEEGDDLVIPLVSAASASLHPLQYTTRHGDTLVTVADRFNVTTENLRQWNHLGSGTLPLGRKIYVAEPVRLAPGSRGRKAKTASKGKATTSHSTAKKTTSRKKTK
ncbi:membrane-bound lytic murein transglycosylase D [Terriglobus roseus]|uniref:Membrane-bound lytic murein transglycosylase D n=2 Tax=Terriglobus roseus TaxID=392734 RepID=A0A1G7QBP8_9BACT|nr:membrane-bound lytic murein transglycosylase D [Terriglobus roseus]